MWLCLAIFYIVAGILCCLADEAERGGVVASLEEMINNLKSETHTLRKLETQLTAMLQEALKSGRRASAWSETDSRVVRLRKKCATLRERIMKRIEAKTKRGEKKSGLTTLPGPGPPLDPPLFAK